MFRAYVSLGLVLAAAAGCAATTGDDSMFIVNNTAPPVGGMCLLTGVAGQPFISSGTINTRSPNGYVLTPLVQSEITSLMGQEAEHTIEVLGANVDLSVVSGSVTLPAADQHFSSLTSGSLAPNAGTANFFLQIVPPDALAAIAAAGTTVTLDASVKLYGRLGGSKVTGRPFDYPVTVCTDHLSPTRASDCMVTNAGPCMTKPAASTNPCQPYQDATISCCTDASGNLVCP